MIQRALREDRLHDKRPNIQPRTAAARDRDRILYCSAFRRLAEVTQVVAAETAHVFHNRLTHSLQVAQVGRRLAERLIKDYRAEINDSVGLDPDVVEAACLAHDLGHPPFGHTAETELNRLSDAFGGFEGNAQSFRIVAKLAFRREGTPGLDLTRATLAGLLKYPWLRGENPDKKDKWGAYASEEDDYDFARQIQPIPQTKTLEAELMDWADDVTYAVHDMEDFYRAGRIPLHLLANVQDNHERQYFFRDIFDGRRKNDPSITSRRSQLENVFSELLRDLFPIDEPYSGTGTQRAALRNLTGSLIGRYIMNVRLLSNGNKCVLHIDQDLRDEILMLKELTWTYVIGAPSLASQQHGQRKIISGLFQEYNTAATEKTPNWAIFPPYYQERLRAAKDDSERMRTCVDLIAGMTEKQAVATYLRLTGVVLGSGLEELLS